MVASPPFFALLVIVLVEFKFVWSTAAATDNNRDNGKDKLLHASLDQYGVFLPSESVPKSTATEADKPKERERTVQKQEASTTNIKFHNLRPLTSTHVKRSHISSTSNNLHYRGTYSDNTESYFGDNEFDSQHGEDSSVDSRGDITTDDYDADDEQGYDSNESNIFETSDLDTFSSFSDGTEGINAGSEDGDTDEIPDGNEKDNTNTGILLHNFLEEEQKHVSKTNNKNLRRKVNTKPHTKEEIEYCLSLTNNAGYTEDNTLVRKLTKDHNLKKRQVSKDSAFMPYTYPHLALIVPMLSDEDRQHDISSKKLKRCRDPYSCLRELCRKTGCSMQNRNSNTNTPSAGNYGSEYDAFVDRPRPVLNKHHPHISKINFAEAAERHSGDNSKQEKMNLQANKNILDSVKVEMNAQKQVNKQKSPQLPLLPLLMRKRLESCELVLNDLSKIYGQQRHAHENPTLHTNKTEPTIQPEHSEDAIYLNQHPPQINRNGLTSVKPPVFYLKSNPTAYMQDTTNGLMQNIDGQLPNTDHHHSHDMSQLLYTDKPNTNQHTHEIQGRNFAITHSKHSQDTRRKNNEEDEIVKTSLQENKKPMFGTSGETSVRQVEVNDKNPPNSPPQSIQETHKIQSLNEQKILRNPNTDVQSQGVSRDEQLESGKVKIIMPMDLTEIYRNLPQNYEFSAGQWLHLRPVAQPLDGSVHGLNIGQATTTIVDNMPSQKSNNEESYRENSQEQDISTPYGVKREQDIVPQRTYNAAQRSNDNEPPRKSTDTETIKTVPTVNLNHYAQNRPTLISNYMSTPMPSFDMEDKNMLQGRFPDNADQITENIRKQLTPFTMHNLEQSGRNPHPEVQPSTGHTDTQNKEEFEFDKNYLTHELDDNSSSAQTTTRYKATAPTHTSYTVGFTRNGYTNTHTFEKENEPSIFRTNVNSAEPLNYMQGNTTPVVMLGQTRSHITSSSERQQDINNQEDAMHTMDSEVPLNIHTPPLWKKISATRSPLSLQELIIPDVEQSSRTPITLDYSLDFSTENPETSTPEITMASIYAIAEDSTVYKETDDSAVKRTPEPSKPHTLYNTNFYLNRISTQTPVQEVINSSLKYPGNGTEGKFFNPSFRSSSDSNYSIETLEDPENQFNSSNVEINTFQTETDLTLPAIPHVKTDFNDLVSKIPDQDKKTKSTPMYRNVVPGTLEETTESISTSQPVSTIRGYQGLPTSGYSASTDLPVPDRSFASPKSAVENFLHEHSNPQPGNKTQSDESVHAQSTTNGPNERTNKYPSAIHIMIYSIPDATGPTQMGHTLNKNKASGSINNKMSEMSSVPNAYPTSISPSSEDIYSTSTDTTILYARSHNFRSTDSKILTDSSLPEITKAEKDHITANQIPSTAETENLYSRATTVDDVSSKPVESQARSNSAETNERPPNGVRYYGTFSVLDSQQSSPITLPVTGILQKEGSNKNDTFNIFVTPQNPQNISYTTSPVQVALSNVRGVANDNKNNNFKLHLYNLSQYVSSSTAPSHTHSISPNDIQTYNIIQPNRVNRKTERNEMTSLQANNYIDNTSEYSLPTFIPSVGILGNYPSFQFSSDSTQKKRESNSYTRHSSTTVAPTVKSSILLNAIYSPKEMLSNISIPSPEPAVITTLSSAINTECRQSYDEFIRDIHQYVETFNSSETQECASECSVDPQSCTKCLTDMFNVQSQSSVSVADKYKHPTAQNTSLEDVTDHPCASYTRARLNILYDLVIWLRRWIMSRFGTTPKALS